MAMVPLANIHTASCPIRLRFPEGGRREDRALVSRSASKGDYQFLLLFPEVFDA